MKITYIRSFSRDETCTHIPHDDVFSCCNCMYGPLTFHRLKKKNKTMRFSWLGVSQNFVSLLTSMTFHLIPPECVCVICEKPREKTMSSHISRILHLYNHGGGETLISKQSIKYFAPIRSYHYQHYIVLPLLHIICIFTTYAQFIDTSADGNFSDDIVIELLIICSS